MFISSVSFCFIIIVQATFKPPKAIGGGIPICFPQVCSSHDNIFIFCHCFHHDNAALVGERIEIEEVRKQMRWESVFMNSKNISSYVYNEDKPHTIIFTLE